MRKTRIYLEVVIILILSFMMIGCKKYEKAPPQSLLISKKECRLCGSGKNSLKTIYKNLSGVGVLCLNDWRMVDILTSNDAAISSNGSSCIWADKNAYSIKITRIASRKISLMQYISAENNTPDMNKLNSFLCHTCMKNLEEALRIYGNHSGRSTKAICMVTFPSMELYGLQHSFQYYIMGDYFAQAHCIGNEIDLTVFFAPENEKTAKPITGSAVFLSTILSILCSSHNR